MNKRKRKINYTKILILLLIIWNMVLTVNLCKTDKTQQSDTQEQYIKSAILDFEVAEIPEINITTEQ